MATLKWNEELLLSSALPPAYTELSYIESSGTQYIDTLLIPKTGTAVELDCEFTETPSSCTVLGTRDGDTRYYLADVSGSKWTIGYGSSSYQSSISPSMGTRYKLECKMYNGSQILRLNNTDALTLTNGGVVEMSGFTLFLFADNYNGVSYFSKIKLYYCKMYYQGVLVRNFIPVKRNSDNVVGLYDTVTNTFFTNQGSGDFIAGTAKTQLEMTDNSPRLKNSEGNLRLVGWGETDVVGMPATTWGGRGLNAGTKIFDDRYLYTTNGRNLYTKVAGYYVFVWKCRVINNSPSCGVGVNVTGSNRETDANFFRWGGSTTRSTITGFECQQVGADVPISTYGYYQSASTFYPVEVWVYVIDNGTT